MVGAVAVFPVVAVFAVFAVVADSFLRASSLSTVLYAASAVGITAVPVALLTIGGEFDLSAGVLVSSVWVGVVVSLLATLAVGLLDGVPLSRTKPPSFITALGSFLMPTGLDLGPTKLISGTVATRSIAGMDAFGSARAVFASTLTVGGVGHKVTVLWWPGLVAVAAWAR